MNSFSSKIYCLTNLKSNGKKLLNRDQIYLVQFLCAYKITSPTVKSNKKIRPNRIFMSPGVIDISSRSRKYVCLSLPCIFV